MKQILALVTAQVLIHDVIGDRCDFRPFTTLEVIRDRNAAGGSDGRL